MNFELDRVNAELVRVNFELDRVNAERDRVNAEWDRVKAERDRVNAELDRVLEPYGQALEAEVDRLVPDAPWDAARGELVFPAAEEARL